MARFTFHNMLRYLPRSLCLPMLALTGCVHAHSQRNAADAETLGLTVDKNGTILLAGKPCYAFGVNSFSLVIRYIEGAEKRLYRSQFELLKKYGIPYIRVNFGGYWPEYYEKFDADPDEILSRMRDVVQCAEEYKIGLICSLLWYDASIPAHVGERRSDMGSSSSKTVKYAVKYVSRIVSEFKDSPAVWAWEIGNEYNLGADLCDPDFHSRLPEGPCTPEAPSGYDFYTSEELIRFYTAIGAAIRKQDPVRMLSSGNGDLRCASKSLRRAAARMNAETHLWKEEWTPDTLEDFYEMCAYFTPDPIDTISFHLQHAEQDEAGRASFLLLLDRFGGRQSTLEYLQAYAAAARKAGKALYFGEMGDMLWMEGDENAASIFKNVADWITDAGIQLASSWQFSKNSLIATDSGIDGEKLKILQKKNQNYIDEGKADTVTYWSNK